MRTIIVVTSFAESHLIQCHIQNIFDIFNPDVVIYNEGLFPTGPEGKTRYFNRDKWCKPGTNAGFDYDITTRILEKFSKMRGIPVVSNIVNFPGDVVSADDAYAFSASTFGEFTPEHGDLIILLEPDAFHHEDQRGFIETEMQNLQAGEGLSSRWVDLVGTQYYTEACNLPSHGGTLKHRRLAYRFDNMDAYIKMCKGFTAQNYPGLRVNSDIITYHFCWFRPFPYDSLRYELITRPVGYWENFRGGLEQIYVTSISGRDLFPVLLRPSRTGPARYAVKVPMFFESYPTAIHDHPCFVKSRLFNSTL